MTAEFIAFYAIERPNAIAVLHDGKPVSYAQMARAIACLSAALGGFGLRRGATVVVQCSDLYGHCLLLLACESLGLVTASISAREAEDVLPLLEAADFVFAEQALPPGFAKPSHKVTPEWLARVITETKPAELVALPRRPDDPYCILRSSGTTGEPKPMLLTRQVFDGRVAKSACFAHLERETRYLVDVPFNVSAAHQRAYAVLRFGGTVVFEHALPPAEAIARYGITHVLISALALWRIVETLPQHFAKPPHLTVTTIGAAVPEPVRIKALARLATELYETYGTNEAYLIAASPPHGGRSPGRIGPGVEVEIVDADGLPLPLGCEGEIRVRVEGMVTSYIGDPEATARAFRGGWFHPGDRGVLHAERRLEVIGRSDELLNVGGFKALPAALEERFREAAAGADFAVVSSPGATGFEQICIAVAGAEDAERDERLARAAARLPGGVRIIAVDAIPRTETGKVRRAELRTALLGKGAR